MSVKVFFEILEILCLEMIDEGFGDLEELFDPEDCE